MQAHCLCKVAELNIPSDGNGITGIHRWEIKEEKMGIKKKKTFTQIVPVAHFLIFQKILMTAKAYRNIATLGSVLQTFEAEKQGDIFVIKKKIMQRFGNDARGDRKLLYFLALGLPMLSMPACLHQTQ